MARCKRPLSRGASCKGGMVETLKESLEKLTESLKTLEDAVALCLEKQGKHKEKIETLQTVIRTTYERIDAAIAKAEKEAQTKEDEICLSLP